MNAMTTEEILKSQDKLKSVFRCPKCLDTKRFVAKSGELNTCLEC
jgi:hypothetical protein